MESVGEKEAVLTEQVAEREKERIQSQVRRDRDERDGEREREMSGVTNVSDLREDRL